MLYYMDRQGLLAGGTAHNSIEEKMTVSGRSPTVDAGIWGDFNLKVN